MAKQIERTFGFGVIPDVKLFFVWNLSYVSRNGISMLDYLVSMAKAPPLGGARDVLQRYVVVRLGVLRRRDAAAFSL